MKLKISNSATLPSRFGMFQIKAFKEGDKEHLAIYKGALTGSLLVRIHSECLTGDALGSLKCDCGEQLQRALEMISKEGGMVIYLRQEGRNIGLFNKVNAYALQDKGFNTIEANLHLGFGEDERKYDVAEAILKYFNITSIRLITNNPKKLEAFKEVKVVERCSLVIPSNVNNVEYLNTKKIDMGHLL